MAQYIDKDALLKEIERRIKAIPRGETDKRLKAVYGNEAFVLNDLLSFIDTIEVIDPYEKCVQYASVESGIKAHAEVYSFNIESELFNQLTKEQQKLWRKEIEQACISGGYCGLNLAKDPRYKENLEAKEVNLDEEVKRFTMSKELYETKSVIRTVAKHFFELGLKASNPTTEVNLESLVRQVIDLYLEAGGHYNSVIKEERKEYGGSDLAIKLFDGVIDAKELSIQYVLDKLKAQKGEQYG